MCRNKILKIFTSILLPCLVVLYLGVRYFSPNYTDDYKKLNDLLSNRKFQQADKQTTRLMAKISRREWVGIWSGLVSPRSLKDFPCKDLNKINQLWISNSNNRFGFTIQSQVWNRFFVSSKDFYSNFDEFSRNVGWLENGQIKAYSALQFSMNAPVGSLPSFDWMQAITPSGSSWADTGIDLLTRTEECKKN